MRVGLPDYKTVSEIYFNVWEVISRRFCGPIEFVPPEVWKPPNSSISYFDALTRNEHIDTFLDLWIISPARQEFLNFSIPVWMYEPTFVIPDPSDEHDGDDGDDGRSSSEQQLFGAGVNYSAMLDVFSAQTWYILLGAGAVLLFVSVMFTSVFPFGHLNPWTWFTHYAQQHSCPDGGTYDSRAVKLFIAITGLFTLHSLSLYQGCLLSQLVKQDAVENPFKSIDEVAELIGSGEAQLNLISPDFHYSRLLTTANDSNSDYDTIRAALARNPPIYETNTVPAKDTLIITLEGDDLFYGRVNHTNCDSLIGSSPLAGLLALMISPHVNQTTLDCLNDAMETHFGQILSVLNSGYDARKRIYKECRRIKMEKRARHVGDPIRMIRLSGSTAAWLGGVMMAVVVLVGEVVMHTGCTR